MEKKLNIHNNSNTLGFGLIENFPFATTYAKR